MSKAFPSRGFDAGLAFFNLGLALICLILGRRCGLVEVLVCRHSLYLSSCGVSFYGCVVARLKFWILLLYDRRPRGSAWVFFFTALVLFPPPVLRFNISLGSRRGVGVIGRCRLRSYFAGCFTGQERYAAVHTAR